MGVFDRWHWAHPGIYTEAASTKNGCGRAPVCPFHWALCTKRAFAVVHTITVGVERPSVEWCKAEATVCDFIVSYYECIDEDIIII